MILLQIGQAPQPFGRKEVWPVEELEAVIGGEFVVYRKNKESGPHMFCVLKDPGDRINLVACGMSERFVCGPCMVLFPTEKIQGMS